MTMNIIRRDECSLFLLIWKKGDMNFFISYQNNSAHFKVALHSCIQTNGQIELAQAHGKFVLSFSYTWLCLCVWSDSVITTYPLPFPVCSNSLGATYPWDLQAVTSKMGYNGAYWRWSNVDVLYTYTAL